MSNDQLPERDPTKTDAQQGLYGKFRIERTDGSSATGCKHHGCDYFVLDVTHDKCAPPALAAYAAAVERTHPLLAADMRSRYGLPAAGDAAMPIRAYEWEDDESGFAGSPRTRWDDCPPGRVKSSKPMVLLADAQAALAAKDAEIERLREELLTNKTAHAASVAEVLRRGMQIGDMERKISDYRHKNFTFLDRIAAQEADLAHSHEAADAASRDAMARIAGLEAELNDEHKQRDSDALVIAGLEADLVEERSRIASMRTEWGAEVAALTAQARHAEDCLEAAKARIADLESHMKGMVRTGRITDPENAHAVKAVLDKLSTDKAYAEQFLAYIGANDLPQEVTMRLAGTSPCCGNGDNKCQAVCEAVYGVRT
jgi:hypothetical protein